MTRFLLLLRTFLENSASLFHNFTCLLTANLLDCFRTLGSFEDIDSIHSEIVRWQTIDRLQVSDRFPLYKL